MSKVLINSNERIHVGDPALFVFEFIDDDTGLPIDLSTQELMEAKFQRPDGTSFTRTAELHTSPGTNGKTKYKAVAADLSVAGDGWIVQGKIKLADEDPMHGPRAGIRVWPVITGS